MQILLDVIRWSFVVGFSSVIGFLAFIGGGTLALLLFTYILDTIAEKTLDTDKDKDKSHD